MQTIKCQPPKSPYHKHEFNVCTEPSSFDPLFMENVNDIADTMAEIMIVCGIHRCKAKGSREIVVKAFQFYDVIRHRYESVDNEAGICRSDIVQDFERVCSMTRIEALLAYCIIKRAIKAFYHGTPDHSIYSPVMEAIIIKQQEVIWNHAARRTIMIFERYEQMFYSSQPNYASQITKIYKELHDRLKRRADPVVLEDFHPRGCVKKTVIGTQSPPKLQSEKIVCVEQCQKTQQLKEFNDNLPPKVFPLKSCLTLPSPCPSICGRGQAADDSPSDDSPPPKKKKVLKKVDLNVPRCYQCNCPKIVCDCDVENTGVLAVDCSQGPFTCQWVLMDKTDQDDTCTLRPEYHQCPVDCGSSESSNDSDFSEYCECSAESNKDDDEDESKHQNMEHLKMRNIDDTNSNDSDLENQPPKNLYRKNQSRDSGLRHISKLPVAIRACPKLQKI